MGSISMTRPSQCRSKCSSFRHALFIFQLVCSFWHSVLKFSFLSSDMSSFSWYVPFKVLACVTFYFCHFPLHALACSAFWSDMFLFFSVLACFWWTAVVSIWTGQLTSPGPSTTVNPLASRSFKWIARIWHITDQSKKLSINYLCLF